MTRTSGQAIKGSSSSVCVCVCECERERDRGGGGGGGGGGGSLARGESPGETGICYSMDAELGPVAYKPLLDLSAISNSGLELSPD